MHLSESYKKRLKFLSGIVSESTSNIQELNIDDVSIPTSYIKDSLNIQIWDGDKLRPEIREHLLKIAKEYIKYIDIDAKPEKVMFLGSMANYNWNESSDFDLHIVYDFKKISDDVDFAKDFFDTKGSNWKSNHKITLKGYDVEIYVQGKDEENKSVGVYDLLNNNWISEPKKEDVKIDKELIKKKAASIATRIEHIDSLSIENSDKVYKEAKNLKDKIKKMRQAGLDKTGEFSVENLAFKYLRNNGYLERLGKITIKSFDKNLSMDENNINESKMKINEINNELPSKEALEIKRIAKQGNLNIARYKMNELIMGFKVEKEHGTVNPITNITNDDEVKTLKIALAHLNEVPDYYTKLGKYVETGVSESKKVKKKLINESTEISQSPMHKLIIKKSVDNLDENKIGLVKKFIVFCCKELGIDKPCIVFLTGERGGPITTTASYNPNSDHIWVYTKNRNMLGDITRSIAHEIRHFKQKLDNELVDSSGDTGSLQENQANAFSGVAIRKFGKLYPEIFQ